MTIGITAAEASMLLTLLLDNEACGEYYGNPDRWRKRREQLIEKIKASVNA